jgi:hypothetical protein
MIKKIKITESQFNRVLGLLVETPFDSMVRSVIKDNDVIKITWVNGVNNFKVLKNDKGNIIIDNIDGSGNNDFRYLINYTSLKGDVIETRRVNKNTESDIIDDVKRWKPFSFTDVSDFQLIRDGKVIDRVEGLKGQSQNKNTTSGFDEDSINDITNSLIYLLDELQDGKGLVINLTKTNIGLCCVGRNSNDFTLEINENKSFRDLDKWDSVNLTIKGNSDDENLIELNKDILKTSDGGKTFDLVLIGRQGEKQGRIWIKGIKGFSITKSCESFDEEKDNKEKNDTELEGKGKEELRQDGKDIYDKILSDERMQKVFYSQPTFWQSFVAELKGEKPVGNGIISVLDIVNKYTNKQITDKIGEGFTDKIGAEVKLIPLKPIRIKYTLDKKNYYKDINNIEPIKIKNFKDDEIPEKVLQRKLGGGNLRLRIIVLSKTDDPNIKKCSVSIGKYNKNTKEFNSLSGESNGESNEEYYFKFLKSDGYEPINNNKN